MFHLVWAVPNAANSLRQHHYPIVAGKSFNFPVPTEDFITTGDVLHDQFESNPDGDPVVKSYLNMTIGAGHIVRPTNRCKGMYLYIAGNLHIEGTLTMTARGPIGPGLYVGIDPYSKSIHFDEEDKFSSIPHFVTISKTGGAGGARYTCKAGTSSSSGATLRGNPGKPGVDGACGGGGSGEALGSFGGTAISGAGTAGTSFSGGSGGGGAAVDACTVYGGNAQIDAGIGGAGAACVRSGSTISRASGGGAGNNGGAGKTANGGSAARGAAGTGGLMILFVKGEITFGDAGVISSLGSLGGSGSSASGGSSGSGAIHIFNKFDLTPDAGKLQVHAVGRAYSKGGMGTLGLHQFDVN